MRTSLLIGLVSTACLLIQSATAAELNKLVDATDPQRLAEIIQDLGYKAKLETDDAGDPVIRSAVGGSQFSVLFFNCNADSHDQCTLLLYRIGYSLSNKPSAENIESWNENALVGRAYRDEDDDPWLEWAVNMDGGVSRKNFEDTFDWWEVSVGDFEKHIEYKNGGS